MLTCTGAKCHAHMCRHTGDRAAAEHHISDPGTKPPLSAARLDALFRNVRRSDGNRYTRADLPACSQERLSRQRHLHLSPSDKACNVPKLGRNRWYRRGIRRRHSPLSHRCVLVRWLPRRSHTGTSFASTEQQRVQALDGEKREKCDPARQSPFPARSVNAHNWCA